MTRCASEEETIFLDFFLSENAMISTLIRPLARPCGISLCLLALSTPLAANAAEEQTAASVLANSASAKEGKPFLLTLLDKFQTMKGYQYETSLTSYNKPKPVTHCGKIIFKNPNLMRFEVTSEGRLGGSVVVRQPDGKVKARSPLFFGMVVGLSPDSKLLRTPNGYSILQSDFASLIQSVVKIVDSGGKCKVTSNPSSFHGVDHAYMVEVMRDPSSVLQRIIVDSRNKTPIEWSLFNGPKLMSVLHVDKLSETPQIADYVFSLDSRDGESKALGEKENIAEVLQENISTLASDAKPGSSLLDDARLALTEISLQCDALAREIPDLAAGAKSTSAQGQPEKVMEKNGSAATKGKHPGSNTTASTTSSVRRYGFLRAASIESIAYSLGKLEKVLARIDSGKADSTVEGKQQTGAPALTSKWHEQLNAINAATTKLYELLQSDSPSANLIVEESRRLQKHDQELASILKEFTTKI